MTPRLQRAIAAYWRHARQVTFDHATPDEIYSLLGHAEQLIAVLVAAVATLEQAASEREAQP